MSDLKRRAAGITTCVRLFAAMFCVLLGGISPARAAPVRFDEIVSSPTCNAGIPDGYGGLTWANVQLECDADYLASFGNSYGSPSGDYAAFNAFGLAAVELTTSGGLFTFGGASFTSWADHDAFSAFFSAQSLALIGYRPGDLADAPTYYLELALDPTTYITQVLNWSGLERLAFVSGDGVTFNTDGLSWLVDDLDVSIESAPVPEPASLSLLSAGVVSLAMARRRRQAQSPKHSETRALPRKGPSCL